MFTDSIRQANHLPTFPEISKTHNPHTSGLLRNNPSICPQDRDHQQNTQLLNLTKQIPTHRHIQQIYYLERRCFL